MNNSIFRGLSVIAILFCMIGVSYLNAAKDPNKDPNKKSSSRLQKTGDANDDYKVLNINNLSTWVKFDGLSNHSPGGDNGMYYPRGTKWVIYEDGLVYGGKVYQDAAKTIPGGNSQPIRMGGSHYRSGHIAGWINGTGASATSEPVSNTQVRAYRVRRDYADMPDDEVKKDASETFEVNLDEVTDAQAARIRADYAKDWNDWTAMVPKGAPFIDRNGDGVYTPPPAFSATFTVDSLIAQAKDEPGIAGLDPNSPADQVIWTVFNDLSSAKTTALNGSNPIGLEFQVTAWGYKRTDALGNLYFKKYRVTNKGGVDVSGTGTIASFWIDSMYVAQWSDPDLGDAGDDLAGSDPALSLGFIYNGKAVDNEYKTVGLPPPAAGYDFLQGPLVFTGNAADTVAVFNLKKKGPGYINLGMSAFSWFAASSAYSDPPSNYASGTRRWYKMFRGFVPLDGPDVPYPTPPGVPPGPFSLSGDPVANTGHVDGLGTLYSFIPGDRRIILTSGPFSMSPGDTQEVVVGTVAGIGADRISSVAVMKFNDRFVQNTYNDLFVVPKSPTPPDVKVAELDGEIVMEWGSNLQRVSDTETLVNNPGAYMFEGYNVYQFPSATASLSDAKRIATYDLPTDPAVIVDEQADPSGVILFKPVQFGSNSGIAHFFNAKRDYVRDLDKLYNGQEYYFAVTAYSRTTVGYLPATLESTPVILSVRPQALKPGVRYSAATGSDVAITHTAGIGDVNFDLKVVDPTKLTGQTYTIGWSPIPNAFSGSTDFLFDADGNTTGTFSADFTVNVAGTEVTYSVKLSQPDSLYSPITGIFFQNAADGVTGPIVKGPLTTSIVLGSVVASGKWTATDVTLPFTAALRDSLVAGRIYVNVTTAADPVSAVRAQILSSSFPYFVNRGATQILSYQINYLVDNNYPVFDGLQLKMASPVWQNPTSYTWSQTVTSSAARPAGSTAAAFYTGFGVNYSNLFPQSTKTTTQTDLVTDLELRFTGVRATRANGTSPEDTVIVSGGSIATVASSNAASIVRIRIPFELWEVDAGTGRNRQINVFARDRNANASSPWGSGGAPLWLRMSSTGARAYFGAVATDYTADATAAGVTAVPRDNPKGTWAFATAVDAGTTPIWRIGDVVRIKVSNPSVAGTDSWSFTAPAAVAFSTTTAKADVEKVGVFPNPYYAFNPAETNWFNRFVTFNFLPERATIRIFNLAGQLVRILVKDPAADPGQFLRWDLNNQYNFPVASGMYVAHVDMPDLGTSRVVKLAIIQEQEVLDVY